MLRNFVTKSAQQTYYQLFLLVGLYCLGWFIQSKTGFTLIRALPALLFLSFLPGYWLIKLTKPRLFSWGTAGYFGLTTLVSFALISSVQFLTKTHVAFTDKSLSAVLLVGNISLAMLAIAYGAALPTLNEYREAIRQWRATRNWKETVIILLPLIVFAFTYFINPTIDDSDSYLNLLQAAIRSQVAPQLARALFLPLLGIYQLTSGINVTILYKLLFSLLFYFSYFLAYDYYRRYIKDRTLQGLCYLSILVAPVIAVEVNIIRPQVVILAFTIPLLLLIIESFRQQEFKLLVLANWLTLLSLGYHELAAIFLPFILIADLAYGFDQIFRRKAFKITPLRILFLLFILYPYTVLFPLKTLLDPALHIFTYALSFTQHLSWRWWFLNSYATVDGYNVSWVGIQALYYYLYNGLPLVLVFLATILIAIRQGSRPGSRPNWWIIPLLYSGIYFCFAEVMPRLGIFFLPNRAWPHLMLGLGLAFTLYIEQHQEQLAIVRRTVLFIVGSGILIGSLATLYLTSNHVGTVFTAELPAARYVRRHTNPLALFVSTQPNSDLVDFYTSRLYDDLPEPKDPHFTNEQEFYQTVNQQVDAILKKVQQPTIIPARKTVTSFYVDDKLVSTEETILNKAQIIKPPPGPDPKNGIYFIYSFAKLQGLNGQRPYNQSRLNTANLSYFQSIHKSNIVYRDKNVIIIKLR